jgi:kynurenine formamidase
MSRYVWLSFPLDVNGPRPPAIPAPELTPLYTVAADGASVQTLRVASHTGTHLDTPCHVVEGGVQIGEFAPEELIFGRPVVIDLCLGDAEVVRPEHLEPHLATLQKADFALFRFGYGAVRRADKARFSQRCPGFGLESAGWLRRECPELRAMGMDVPSLACIACLDETMKAHNILLEGEGRRFLVIEEMDLEKDLAGLREVRVSPWLVKDMDSGPCTVVGVIG